MVCSGGPTESRQDGNGEDPLRGERIATSAAILHEKTVEELEDLLTTSRKYLISPSGDTQFIQLVDHDLRAITTRPSLQVNPLPQDHRALLFNCARLMSLVGLRYEHEGYHAQALESFKYTLALDEKLIGVDPAVGEYYGYDLVNVGRTLFALKDFPSAAHLLQTGLERYREVRPRDAEFVTFIVQSAFVSATEWSPLLPKQEALAALDVPRSLCKAFPDVGVLYLDPIDMLVAQLKAR